MDNISLKKAIIINFISKYSNVIVQLLLNSLLARILTPNDYGVVAVISVFISFFIILADMGIGPAIIQYKDLNKREISDIFIFTIFSAVCISGMFIVFSIPISIFYDNSVYFSLGIILSFSILFNVLNIVPNAILLKQKRFKLLGIRTIIVTIIGGIITVVLAINGAKYYALAINSVLVAFLTLILNLYNVKMKLYLSFNMQSVNIIKSYSAYQFGFNFINYFSRNLDNLLVGKFLGEIPLGYYDKAYKLMLYPIQNLANVITPVLQPILSERQNEKDFIYSEYVKITKILALMGSFITAFCYFSAREIVLIMFGDQWGDAVPAFKILSISIIIQMVLSSAGSIFQSLGETKKMFYSSPITTTTTVVCIIGGLSIGSIEAVSWGIVLSYVINFIVVYYILIRKVFERKLNKFLKEFVSTFIILILMIIGLICIPTNFSNALLSVTIKLIITSIIFIVGLVMTKEMEFLKELLRR